MKKFEGRSTERTWLTAILKNKLMDVYRKKASGLKNATDNSVHERISEDGFFETEDGHWEVVHQPEAFGLEKHDPYAS